MGSIIVHMVVKGVNTKEGKRISIVWEDIIIGHDDDNVKNIKQVEQHEKKSYLILEGRDIISQIAYAPLFWFFRNWLGRASV